MIRTLLYLHASPGRADALLTHYREHDVLAASLDYGRLDGEIGATLEDPQTIVVTSTWESTDHYAAWSSSTRREQVLAGLAPLLDPARPAHSEVVRVSQRHANPRTGAGAVR